MKTNLQRFKSTTLMLNLACCAMIAIMTISCAKSELPTIDELVKGEQKISTVSLTIKPEEASLITKATGSGHGIQSDDNTVSKLDVFIFGCEGTNKGILEAYKRFEASELTTLSGLEIKSSVGLKSIYVVANSHEDWSGVKTIEAFEEAVCELKDEELKSFTMFGKKDQLLEENTNVEISLKRFVARVQLSGLRVNFSGTPYDGSSLTNVKVYLLNVNADKIYHSGLNSKSPLIYNYKKASDTDIAACKMNGMIYDEIESPITSGGYTTLHTFYCYENSIFSQNSTERFTKLVIQGDINGKTYYYPININQEGFGYNSSNDHYGIKRNTSYSLDVTICRLGSSDPDKNLEVGTLQMALTTVNWTTIPVVQVEF